MTGLSQNGWPLLTRAQCEDVAVPGGVLPTHPRLAVIAADLAHHWHLTVEPLQWPGCWGYAGPDRFIGGTTTPSNHWSGSAWDFCAPQHPQAVPVHITFTTRELEAVAALEARYAGVLMWGGRWVGNSVDGMHWEVRKGARLEDVDALTDRIMAEVAAMTTQSPSAPLSSPPVPTPSPAGPGWTGPDLQGQGLALRGDQGNNGPRVAALQRFWRDRYPLYAKSLAADGWWGDGTSAVCAQFAARSGIRGADGRNVGPLLAARLHGAGFRG